MLGPKQTLLLESCQRLLRRNAATRVAHLLSKSRAEDIALIIPRLTSRECQQTFGLLEDRSQQAEVLSELEQTTVTMLLEPISVAEQVAILHEMSNDDVADILAFLPEEQSQAILEHMQEQESIEVEGLMGYDPDSAGGIMSPDFFALQKSTTIRDAITALQEQAEELEMAFYVYVINEHSQLVGVVSLRQLVTSRPDLPLSTICEHDVINVPADADQEEVARVVARYNFLAVPVVDDTNKLLGIVTVDDVIDVLYEAATEDILKLAGAGTELPTNDGLFSNLKQRYPWLLASCIGGFIAAFVMAPFSGQLESTPFLALFIPIIMGMGGNVGIQSSTIIVRGLATGHIELDRVKSVIRRELGIGLVLGIGYGFLVGGGAALYWWLTNDTPNQSFMMYFGIVIGLSLAAAMLVAATVGTFVPLGLERIQIDPAVATGPFVTTAVDVLGIFAYFSIAIGLADAFGL